MAKKKTVSLEEIKSISHESLASLVHKEADNNKEFYKKIEKLLLKSDIKSLVKSIKKDIASIKRGSKFISYRESFDFSKKIADIVEDISEMLEDKKIASELFKELILTDSKVYLRSDDSAGAIQTSYSLAEKGWNSCVDVLNHNEIYEALMEMRICEGFGVRDIFSDKIPSAVLHKIYQEFYTKSEELTYGDIHTLQLCAHFLKDPQMYIDATKLNRDEIRQGDLLDFAQEYKYAQNAKGIINILKSIQVPDRYHADRFFELKIWAHKQSKQPLEVTSCYKEWYRATKSVRVLKEYLNRLEGVLRKQELEVALDDAKQMSFHEAINFFYSLDEIEQAVSYIKNNSKNINTVYMQAKDIKKIVDWLEKKYPQEAILLYRDVCEKALKTSNSKYYPSAIKALNECFKIEKSNNIVNWHIESNDIYTRTIYQKNSNKPKFVELFIESIFI